MSFGLPARPILNSVFLAAGFGAGLDSAIVNPMSFDIMKTVRGFKVLNNQDVDAVDYISNYADYVFLKPVPAKIVPEKLVIIRMRQKVQMKILLLISLMEDVKKQV